MLTQNEKVELRKRIDATRVASANLVTAKANEFKAAIDADEAAWRELFRFIKENL